MDNHIFVDLVKDIGKIKTSEEICPGVYFLTAKKEQHSILLSEYYAVLKTSKIFPKVQNYGKEYASLRLYSIDTPSSGWKIVEYETGKYLVKRGLPLRNSETLHSIAVSAAEYHPEYFGAYPAPLHTPCGYTLRYWTLENGIYWIETDQCEDVLAVCYSVWDAELTDTIRDLGEQTAFDRKNGIHNTLGYLFFRQPAAAAAIYELMLLRASWEGTLVDKRALANAIWASLPQYAVLSNWREQNGQNSILSILENLCGIDLQKSFDPKNAIAIYPDAGTHYLLFK